MCAAAMIEPSAGPYSAIGGFNGPPSDVAQAVRSGLITGAAPAELRQRQPPPAVGALDEALTSWARDVKFGSLISSWWVGGS